MDFLPKTSGKSRPAGGIGCRCNVAGSIMTPYRRTYRAPNRLAHGFVLGVIVGLLLAAGMWFLSSFR